MKNSATLLSKNYLIVKKYILLPLLGLGNLLFGQEFFPPTPSIQTTESLGFKNNTKRVIEYVEKQGGETKKVYYFNKKGVLTIEESYEKKESRLSYSDDDHEGQHLSQKTVYKFKKNRLAAIEISKTIEALAEDADGMPQINKLFMETRKLPYTYDENGRLKSYIVLNQDKELIFHLSYLNPNTTQYYFLPNKTDSVLVYETRIEQEETHKKVISVKYEKGGGEVD